MKCYVDDDLDSDLLLRLAGNQGHEIVSPRSVELRGARDSAHLAYTARNSLPILTGNTGDFESLHDLAVALRGQHFGILIVYSEANVRRQMKASHIVNALTRIESEQVPLANRLVVVNHYR